MSAPSAASGGIARDGCPPSVAGQRRFGVLHFVDPEWPLFVGCLLLPALVCAIAGDSARALFFTRLALLLGALKWLGWLILTRPAYHPRSFLRFPVELIVGLTVIVSWFYLRNIESLWLRDAFALGELRPVTWGIAVTQLIAGATVHVRAWQRQKRTDWTALGALLDRGSTYLPFVLTITLTLWSVSKEVFVPSQDGWYHAFIARVFLNDGIFYRHFNGQDPIFYTSGFGAINAVTAAASGLTVVQTSNMQHLLWIVTGLFAVTSTVALLAERALKLIHFLPPIFLALYPAHNLPPDIYWTHTPQQTGAALLVAIPLLSFFVPATSRRAFNLGLAAQGMLSLLVLALSPVCALFLPLSSTLAFVISWRRARRHVGDALFRVAAVQAIGLVVAAAVILSADRYYSAFISNAGAVSYMKSAQFGGEGATRPAPGSFSIRLGARAAAAVRPLRLLPDWLAPKDERAPGDRLPWLITTVALAVCVLAWRDRNAGSRTAVALAALACGALMSWATVKYGATFASGGIANAAADLLLLQEYLVFMARRLELLLLFATLTAVLGILAVWSATVERSAAARVVTVGLPAAVVFIWLPVSPNLTSWRGRLMPTNIGLAGRMTMDDIELAHWIEREIPPGKGLVGTANIPFMIGDAKLLFPIDASQALSLYGKGYNFCFQIFDPGREYGYDDYVQYVVNYFDGDWCSRNGIRYFHLPLTNIYPNHGLERARQVGLLEPIRSVSSSALYAVRPLPWKPVVVPGPPSPHSSHQVSWQPDGSGIAQGHDPHVVFALAQPTFVHAIRFKLTLTNAWNAAAVPQLFWSSGSQGFVEGERTARLRLETGPREQTLTILVHDTIERFRIDPDAKQCTFRIRDVELLTKPAGAPAR